MKAKALVSVLLAIGLLAAFTACNRTNDKNNSSSMAPPAVSSVPPITSTIPSAAESVKEDVEDGIHSVASDIASKTAMSTDFDEIGAHSAHQVQWGPSTLMDEENRPIACTGLQDQYGKYGAYFIGPSGKQKMYLTFDEGYENGQSGAILDVLKEKEVSAVFFVTMHFVTTQPELVQRMIDEGHIIGNHTNHHWNPTQKTLEEAKQDIQDLHDYMLENFQYEMTLYRPPEGAFSEQTLLLAQQMGYTSVLWSFAYADWDPNNQPDNQAALERMITRTHDGGIFLLHAVSQTNAEVLGPFIDATRAQGIQFAEWDLPYVPAA